MDHEVGRWLVKSSVAMRFPLTPWTEVTASHQPAWAWTVVVTGDPIFDMTVLCFLHTLFITFFVSVLGPLPPSSIEVVPCSDSSISVTVSYDHEPSVSQCAFYSITFTTRLLATATRQQSPIRIPYSGNVYHNVSDLTDSTEYNVTVSAISESGSESIGVSNTSWTREYLSIYVFPFQLWTLVNDELS